MSIEPGTLYVVATPIGNLGDISRRALQVLNTVDLIAAEDTRHSRKLLREFGISTAMKALHEHNEEQMSRALLARLESGESVALISDAGTPLISDPGFQLVRKAREEGLAVVPVPGPSALVAALSVSGLPTDRFVFEGFLPAKGSARCQVLERLRDERRTLVFYEAPHRVEATLGDMAAILGAERRAVLARELTKTFETVRGDTLEGLARFVAQDPQQRKGEIVLIVQGAPEPDTSQLDAESRRVADILAGELSIKQAAALAARITGLKKNLLYRYLVETRE